MGITERIDAITEIPENWRSCHLPTPKSVKIELTARCNFACDFCARSDKLRTQADMDWSLYSRLIREMREAGVEELGLFYLGESFLLKWLPAAIAEAKGIGFPYVFLTTNGSLATAKRTRACFEAGLDSLKFSFNYQNAEQLERVAHVKQSIWHSIRQNLLDARIQRDSVADRTGHRCGLYASYIQYGEEHVESMRPHIEWLEVICDEVYALPLYNHGGFCKDKIREAGLGQSVAGNIGRAEAGSLGRGNRDPLPCWAVFREGHVTFQGKLSACCFDHNDSFDMADLTKVSFAEGWNSTAFRQLRAAHLDRNVDQTPCGRCVAWQ